MPPVVRLESANQTTWEVLASVFVAWLTQIYSLTFFNYHLSQDIKTSFWIISHISRSLLLSENNVNYQCILQRSFRWFEKYRTVSNLVSPIAECDKNIVLYATMLALNVYCLLSILQYKWFFLPAGTNKTYPFLRVPPTVIIPSETTQQCRLSFDLQFCKDSCYFAAHALQFMALSITGCTKIIQSTGVEKNAYNWKHIINQLIYNNKYNFQH